MTDAVVQKNRRGRPKRRRSQKEIQHSVQLRYAQNLDDNELEHLALQFQETLKELKDSYTPDKIVDCLSSSVDLPWVVIIAEDPLILAHQESRYAYFRISSKSSEYELGKVHCFVLHCSIVNT